MSAIDDQHLRLVAFLLISILFVGLLIIGLKLREALRTMGEIIASGSKIPKLEHPTDGEFQDWDKNDPGRDPSS